MTHWPTFMITTVAATGEIVESFDITPEEWVAGLVVADDYVYVSAKPCCECHYLPESSISLSMQQEMRQVMPVNYLYPVCICAQVADWKGKYEVPNDAVCYSYFYMHWNDNPYFLAAQEAGRVKYFDMSGYGGLKGSGLLLYKTGWDYNERRY